MKPVTPYSSSCCQEGFEGRDPTCPSSDMSIFRRRLRTDVLNSEFVSDLILYLFSSTQLQLSKGGSLLFGYQDTVRIVVAFCIPSPILSSWNGYRFFSGDQDTPSSKSFSSHRPLRQFNSRSLSEMRRNRPVSALVRLGIGCQSLSG